MQGATDHSKKEPAKLHLNRTAENQSHYKENQWFQNGFNKAVKIKNKIKFDPDSLCSIVSLVCWFLVITGDAPFAVVNYPLYFAVFEVLVSTTAVKKQKDDWK